MLAKMAVSCGASTISSLFYGETGVNSVLEGLKSSAWTGVFSLLTGFGGTRLPKSTPSVRTTFEKNFLARYITFFKNFF